MKKIILIGCMVMLTLTSYSNTNSIFFGEVESGQITSSCGQKWNYTMHYGSGWSEAERMLNRFNRYQELQAAVDFACNSGATVVHFDREPIGETEVGAPSPDVDTEP